jgi:hypothetical protein
MEAINKQDVALVLLTLSYTKPEDVNMPFNSSDKRTS